MPGKTPNHQSKTNSPLTKSCNYTKAKSNHKHKETAKDFKQAKAWRAVEKL